MVLWEQIPEKLEARKGKKMGKTDQIARRKGDRGRIAEEKAKAEREEREEREKI